MSTTLKPAGLWIRTAAGLIDMAIILIPYFAWWYVSEFRHPSIEHWVLTVLDIIYCVAFLSSCWQATPGKRLLKIYVVHAGDYRPIGKLRAFCRYLVLAGPMLIPVMSDSTMISYEPSQHDLARYESLASRTGPDQPKLSTEEIHFMERVISAQAQTELERLDAQRLNEISAKLERKESLTSEEQKFFDNQMQEIFSRFGFTMVMLLLDAIYLLFFMFVIGLTKEKKGPHDMLCKTRVVRGRPERTVVT